MTLPKLAEDIIKTAQGGIFANSSKFEIPYIYDLIHQYREVVLRMVYTKTGRINPVWTQKYIPEFVKEAQESSLYVVFDVPAPIVLDDQTDGFLYIGTQDKACNFRKNQNRAELAMYQHHRSTKVGINGPVKTIYSDGRLECWGNPLLVDPPLVDAVWQNPTLLPEYNFELSDYPLGGDDIMAIKKMIFDTQTDNMAKSPTNRSVSMQDKPTTVK